MFRLYFKYDTHMKTLTLHVTNCDKCTNTVIDIFPLLFEVWKTHDDANDSVFPTQRRLPDLSKTC